MERVSAERALPAHTATATTAEGAYQFSAIVKRADHKHLDLPYLQKAALDPAHLSSLRAGHTHGRRVDTFVDHVLGLIRVGSDESARAAASGACQWLGLYNVCRKVLRVRQGITIVAEPPDADEGAFADQHGARLPAVQLRLRHVAALMVVCIQATSDRIVAESGVTVGSSSDSSVTRELVM